MRHCIHFQLPRPHRSEAAPPYCIRWCTWGCGIGALQPMKPAPVDKAVFSVLRTQQRIATIFRRAM